MCYDPACAEDPPHALLLDEQGSKVCPIPLYSKDHAREAILECGRYWSSTERSRLLEAVESFPLPNKIPAVFEGATLCELVAEYEEHLRRRSKPSSLVILRFYYLPQSGFIA